MQPHHQLPRIPLSRLTTSDPPSELPPLRSRPMFIPFKPSTLSTRPFTITNTISQLTQPDAQDTLSSLRRPLLEQELPTIRAQSKCQFCNEDFDSDQIMSHVMDCDMQKLTCDKCGDRVAMQIYDIHYEECSIISHRMEAMELRAPIYRRRIIDMDDDDDSLDEDRTERRTMYLPENGLSYEELLRLDETIVKKGMTEEEMEKFRVHLYVKSLDGEGCCNICLSDYETAEYTRELPCKHKFHRQCIDKWLEANITCPMCKKYLR